MSNLGVSVVIEAIDRLTKPVRTASSSVDRLAERFDAATADLSRLDGTAAKVRGFRTLKRSTVDARQAWEQAQGRVAKLAREIRDTEAPTQAQQKAFAQAQAEAKRLKVAYQAQEDRLRRLRGELDRAGIDTRDLARAERDLRSRTDDATRSLDQQRRKMDAAARAQAKLADAQDRLSKRMDLAGNISLAGDSVGRVAGVMRRGVGAAITPVRSLSAELGELATVGVQNLDLMAREGQKVARKYAGMSSAIFVDAAYDIKSGLSFLADDAVAGVTRAAAVGARATKAELDQMTSLTATAHGIYKRLYQDMGDVAFVETFQAQLAASVQAFKTTGSAMQRAIENAGDGASLLGMSMADQLAVLGMMQKSMSEAESGTAFKAFTKQAAKAQEYFDQNGLAIDVLDENNMLRRLPDILADIKAQYGDTYDAVTGQKIFEAFGSDEAVRVVQSLWDSADAFDQQSAAVDKAGREGLKYVERMALLRDNNLDSKLTLASQAVGVLSERLGQHLAPHIQRVLPLIDSVVDRVTGWLDANPALAATLGGVALAATGVTTVLAGVFPVVASVIGSWAMMRFASTVLGVKFFGLGGAARFLGRSFLGLVKLPITIVRGLASLATASNLATVRTVALAVAQRAWAVGSALVTGALRAVTLGVRVMSVALMSNPIGAIIGGIALAAGLIYTYWEPIKGFAFQVWDAVAGVVSTSWDVIKALFGFTPLGLVINNWEPIKGFFTGLWDGITSLTSTAFDAIASIITAPLDAITGIWDRVAGLFGGDDKDIPGPTVTLTERVRRVVEPVAAPVQRVAQPLGRAARAAVMTTALATAPMAPAVPALAADQLPPSPPAVVQPAVDPVASMPSVSPAQPVAMPMMRPAGEIQEQPAPGPIDLVVFPRLAPLPQIPALTVDLVPRWQQLPQLSIDPVLSPAIAGTADLARTAAPAWPAPQVLQPAAPALPGDGDAPPVARQPAQPVAPVPVLPAQGEHVEIRIEVSAPVNITVTDAVVDEAKLAEMVAASLRSAMAEARAEMEAKLRRRLHD